VKMSKKPCRKCKYAKSVCAGPENWFFTGCFYGDYRGKWVAEIENCPMKVMHLTDEQSSDIQELYRAGN